MSNYDWMLDVLADIEDYARTNGLPQIADEVKMARNTVSKELSDQQKISTSVTAQPLFRVGTQISG